MEGSRSFTDDAWALFNLEEDFSEAHDLAAEHPEKLAELEAAWWAAADRYSVLPLDDGYAGRMPAIYPPAYPPPAQARYRPWRGPGSRRGDARVGAGVHHRRLSVDGLRRSRGHLCGPWAIGPAAWPSTDWTAPWCWDSAYPATSSSWPPHRFPPTPPPWGVDINPRRRIPASIELLVDGEVAARLELDRTLPNSWQNGGTGLIIGYDTGFPVNDDYQTPFPWTGTIAHIDITTPSTAPPDPAQITRESLNAD